ncbi:hybrid sensor histidine kinase/response regulator [Psychroserpens algicola]|uniref:hybrid sensor histidine kinase/response regulator n=1 Tax=Psychroserpens algicola TaxID=1719034 RepID=UPI001953AD5A|nr:hybrid sensor histidine kinase/response regulator [Psychroserpens algicola]
MKLTLLFTYLLGLSVYAQDLPFNPQNSKGQLYEYAEFINIQDRELSIDELIEDRSLEFATLQSENQSVGFTSDNFWVRFQLENTSDEQETYYLETARPITDIANLYHVSESEIEVFKSGDQINFSERQVAHRLTVFKITLQPNAVQEYYLHFKSDGETINMPLNLYDESSFWMMNYKQQLFLGLFYGLLFLASIIYLFFYSSLREKTFLYYGIYVFSIGLMQAALDGFIFQYILPEGGFLNSRAVLITALSSNFFLLKYCEYFLKIDMQLASFKRAYNVIYVVLAVLFVMVFISPKTLELVYPISNVNGLFSLILILATVLKMRFKRMSIDPYFSVGIFFLVLGLLGFVMNNLSLIPNNFYTLNSAKFGSGFEVIFLSLSMTNLLRRLREEKEHSQEEALRKSEEISELKTYFMSNISHELRTPINAIMGIAELELKSPKHALEDREQYQVIKNASLSLLSNVNDILDFEKIEKNELKLKHEVFNPSLLVNQISNNWKSEAEKKGLSYKFDIDYEIPTTIIGDAERFIQIINNVLSNAVKFTEKGHIKFKLKCSTQPNQISRFSIQISDTGIGMDDNSKKNVFDSFNQMRLNHKRQFGGIGLGLTIVKHLVELFEGSIQIESKLEQGTNVFIELPLQYIEDVEAPNAQISQNAKLKQHVLVVEDNKMNQMVIKKLLATNSQMSFFVVNNGQEALEALKNDVFDIVLMDLQMPVMDGYEATKIIRSGQLGLTISEIPIIAVTADATEETQQKVMALGMNDYMTKPINKDVLFKKMEACHVQPKLKIA